MTPEEIKANRVKFGITQVELANKAGFTPFTITRIETGKKCKVSTVRKVSLALQDLIAALSAQQLYR